MDPRRGQAPGISDAERQAELMLQVKREREAKTEDLRISLQTVFREDADRALELSFKIATELDGVQFLAEKKRRRVFEAVETLEEELRTLVSKVRAELVARGDRGATQLSLGEKLGGSATGEYEDELEEAIHEIGWRLIEEEDEDESAE